jgi:hypothetical protein
LAAAVSRRNLLVVERACDLGKASSAGVLEADPLNDASWQRRRSSRTAALASFARRLDVLAQKRSSSATGISR